MRAVGAVLEQARVLHREREAVRHAHVGQELLGLVQVELDVAVRRRVPRARRALAVSGDAHAVQHPIDDRLCIEAPSWPGAL